MLDTGYWIPPPHPASRIKYQASFQILFRVYLLHKFTISNCSSLRWELAYIKNSEAVLFDQINYPEQINNQYHDANYKNIVEELTQRIITHNEEVSDPEVN
ncbi:hypothetical protein H8E88_34475 [candidate division KSB1 bacterium]|nr:hypothetical protein [candidate division KSB1 bacterium]